MFTFRHVDKKRKVSQTGTSSYALTMRRLLPGLIVVLVPLAGCDDEPSERETCLKAVECGEACGADFDWAAWEAIQAMRPADTESPEYRAWIDAKDAAVLPLAQCVGTCGSGGSSFEEWDETSRIADRGAWCYWDRATDCPDDVATDQCGG